MPSAVLSDRTRRVLATLVREYIETGEPVASATLSRRAGLDVSSATIRNVLAQLEEMGYVWQPHTSAGRVPTDLGYRFYVDMLLEARRATKDASGVEARLRQEAGDAPLIDDLLSSTSHVLSEVSRHVGFAIAPAERARDLPAHRVRAAQRHPDPGRHGRARQSGVAEDRGHRRGRQRRPSWCRPPTT